MSTLSRKRLRSSTQEQSEILGEVVLGSTFQKIGDGNGRHVGAIVRPAVLSDRERHLSHGCCLRRRTDARPLGELPTRLGE